jgi:hypothetical protein
VDAQLTAPPYLGIEAMLELFEQHADASRSLR